MTMMMTMTGTDRLQDIPPGRLRPLNQAVLKSVLTDLKDIGKAEPAVSALLDGDSPLRDFIAAALTLSPYLRETANFDPALVAAAITEPLQPQIERLVAEARDAWRAEPGGAAPSESEVMSRLRIA